MKVLRIIGRVVWGLFAIVGIVCTGWQLLMMYVQLIHPYEGHH